MKQKIVSIQKKNSYCGPDNHDNHLSRVMSMEGDMCQDLPYLLDPNQHMALPRAQDSRKYNPDICLSRWEVGNGINDV